MVAYFIKAKMAYSIANRPWIVARFVTDQMGYSAEHRP